MITAVKTKKVIFYRVKKNGMIVTKQIVKKYAQFIIPLFCIYIHIKSSIN